MNSNKDWTDKLPELFEGYTEAEPDGLWDAVRAGIEPKKKRPFGALWYAGVLLAAAAVAAIALLLWNVLRIGFRRRCRGGIPIFRLSLRDPSRQSRAPPVTATGCYGSRWGHLPGSVSGTRCAKHS